MSYIIDPIIMNMSIPVSHDLGSIMQQSLDD
jgi:hypothetical protein